MTKKILPVLPLFLAAFLIGTSCDQETKPVAKTEFDQSKVIIEAIPYAEVQAYVDTIRNLDEYKNNIPDQFKSTHIFSFDVRKMIVNDSVYYHLELWKTRIARPVESTIPTPEALAYFRILPKTKQILILDRKTKQFLDLSAEKGKTCLDKCMR